MVQNKRPARRRDVNHLLWTVAWTLLSALGSRTAEATFHFMHVEQVVGGVNGNTSAQAIQLRMRVVGQHQVEKARLRAWDAAGQNPILLIDFDHSVPEDASGSRTLIASPDFASYTSPAAKPDFTLTNLIPPSYLAAGSITFDNDGQTLVVCRLAWGGAGYTGTTAASLTNDDDGNVGPPFPSPLPSAGLQALRFQNSLDLSTTNVEDYALTVGPAVFINNAGESFTLITPHCATDPPQDADADGVCSGIDNCLDEANSDQTDRDGDGAGDACDGCPDDPQKAEPGTCGCGKAETDSNSNAIPDCQEPEIPGETEPPTEGGTQPTDTSTPTEESPPVMPPMVVATPACSMGAALQGTIASFLGLLTLRWGQWRKSL